MSEKTDVWQGTLALMILETLEALGPLHGYGVARRIEQTSGNKLGNRESDGKYARFNAHGFPGAQQNTASVKRASSTLAKDGRALYLQDGGEKSRAWSVHCIRP